MAGWHVDDEPFALAPCDPLERLGHNFVVTPADELGPHLFNEPHERISGTFLLQHLLAALQILEDHHLFGVGQFI